MEALWPNRLTRTALRLDALALPLLAVSAAVLTAGMLIPWARIALVALQTGAVLLGVAVLVRALAALYRRRWRALVETLAAFLEHDPAPCFTTDSAGSVGYLNPAAAARFGGAGAATLMAVLGDSFAAPRALLVRLQNRAEGKGAAHEEVAFRDGHVRLSVHRLGDDRFLWRLEDLATRGQPRGADTIGLPMMTASHAGTILSMNAAMVRLLGGQETTLERIFSDLPLRSGQVHEVATGTGTLRCRVAEIAGPVGRREIYLLPAQADDDASDWPLADDFPVAMLKLMADGRVLIANRRARELLGPETPEDRTMADLVEGLGRSVTDWLGDAADGLGERQPEVVRARRPDRELYLQIRLGRVETDDEPQLVAVLSDITELKMLEAQVIQSQKMEAIGQLAGGVAHDFNNLLTAISGHCDLLLLRHDATDGDYPDLIQISHNANRAAALVSQLLAFSRKQQLQPQVLDLREVLADHAHLLNRLVGEKVMLSVDHTEDLPRLRADRRQFEQVMMNLVVNARDAMPDGGEVRIRTEALTLREPFHRDGVTLPAGDYVVIRVADQGTGIAPDSLPRIFEPFFTTKGPGEGTGLGLSTAYGIVKQSGGYIFADSEVGKGTEFSLYFPVRNVADEGVAAVHPARPPQSAPARQGGVVLLVEDEAPVRAFASRALRMRGFTVIEAANAEEALQTLTDPDLAVDVFVTDVVMPGIDGPTWVAQARKDRPDVRVVFVSGYAEDAVVDQRARAPNSVFLPKPFSLNELTATVARQLH